MVKEMEKKRILPVAAGSSRQHALMRKEAGRKPFVGSMLLCARSGGGKKISTPLTFFPSDTKSSHGMDPLVPSQRIAQNDST